jgi:type III restriction enzyme
LNMSYVFTASNRFMETLDKVVKGLNRAGFSDRDYRAVDAGSTVQETVRPTQQELPDAASGQTIDYPELGEEINILRILENSAESGATGFPRETSAESDKAIEELKAHAQAANKEFMGKAGIHYAESHGSGNRQQPV